MLASTRHRSPRLGFWFGVVGGPLAAVVGLLLPSRSLPAESLPSFTATGMIYFKRVEYHDWRATAVLLGVSVVLAWLIWGSSLSAVPRLKQGLEVGLLVLLVMATSVQRVAYHCPLCGHQNRRSGVCVKCGAEEGQNIFLSNAAGWRYQPGARRFS